LNDAREYAREYNGGYYKVTISVGESGTISTVYNVGKLKKDTLPNGNIKTILSGSKANSVSSLNSIPDSSQKVNNSGKKVEKRWTFRAFLCEGCLFTRRKYGYRYLGLFLAILDTGTGAML